MNNAPNILLTNLCNARCEYCFARDEMNRNMVQEMKYKDFLKVVKFLKKNKVTSLRLMGGEPTLHTQFEKVVMVGLKKFDNIVIFSNGLIPIKSKQILMDNPEKLQFNFNIDTPDCRNSFVLRKRVAKTIQDFIGSSEVSIGFTVSDLSRDYLKLFDVFPKKSLRKMGVRLGYAKAVMGQKYFFKHSEFKKLGTKLIKIIRSLKKLGLNDIYIDCGLEKEMFTSSDLSFLLSQTKMHGWGCEGKWSSFDIATDLTIFPCFPHYKQKRFKLKEFRNLGEALVKCNEKKQCYERV